VDRASDYGSEGRGFESLLVHSETKNADGGVDINSTPPFLDYSHSIVPGGFEVMSYTTRLMPGTSLTIRLEMISKIS
jgi:hypothetical protein